MAAFTALPRAADAAEPLDAALTGGAAALRDGDRTLEDIENLRRGDLVGTAREAVPALRAARGNDHAGTLQPFQDLAHRGPAETRALRQLRGGAVPRGLLR